MSLSPSEDGSEDDQPTSRDLSNSYFGQEYSQGHGHNEEEDGNKSEKTDGDEENRDASDDEVDVERLSVEPDHNSDTDDKEDGVNHPKMAIFQSTVKKVLERQLDLVIEQIREAEQVLQYRKRATEEKGKLLHASQKKLVLEEERVRNAEKKLKNIRNKREKLETENVEKRKELQILESKVEEKMTETEALREAANELSTKLLETQMKQLELENKLGVEQGEANKGEQDRRLAESAKGVQDAYLASLSDQLEQLASEVEVCKGQAAAMDSATADTQAAVYRAQAELKAVEKEQSKLLTLWSNTVVNINKRDEALSNFQDALKEQRIRLLSVKNKVEGVKKEILGCQSEHEVYTEIQARIERFCLKNQEQIQKLEKSITEEKIELGRLGQARTETEISLRRSEAEVKQCEAEDSKLRESVLKLEAQRRELESRVLDSLREQMVSEKSASEADHELNTVMAKISELESNLTEERNRLKEVSRAFANTRLKLMHEQQKRDRLNLAISQLEEEEKKVGMIIRSTVAAIEKAASIIATTEHELRQAMEKGNGEDMNPLEAEVARCRDEIAHLAKQCLEKKKEWSSKQNQLIKIHLSMEEARQELEQARNKEAILEEKRDKNQAEIAEFTGELSRIRKRMDGLDFRIKKLNSDLASGRSQLDTMDSNRAAKINEDLAQIADISEEVELLREEVTSLETNRHMSSENVLSVDREVHEWEEKVKNCSDTAQHLGEGNLPRGEMENLRCEVHYMEQRLKDVARMTKELIAELEGSVMRRECLFEKINAGSGVGQRNTDIRDRKERTGKIELERKISDLEKINKKLESTLNRLRGCLRDAQDKAEDLENGIAVARTAVLSARDRLEELQLEARNLDLCKESKFSVLVQIQSMAKWYRQVREHQYRQTGTRRDQATNRINFSDQDQYKDFKDVLEKLTTSYSDCALTFKRADSMLVVPNPQN